MTLDQAIAKNRRDQARYRKAERLLREIRLRTYDYEDAGKLDKAHRIIEKLKVRLAPLWDAREHASQERRLRNYQM